MKLKSLLFAVCVSLVGQTFAANQHLHPKANEVDSNNKSSVAAKSAMSPGYCEIEIYNTSYNDVWVYGSFDDGYPLDSFRVYQMEAPHYISLFYNGYCHYNGMRVIVEAIRFPFNTIVYDAWTYPNSTIRVVPYATNNLNGKNESGNPVKVEVSKNK